MVKTNTKFKETELGPIPEEWEVLPIYELAEWINGLAFKNIHFTREGMPVIKINELKYGITEQTQFTLDVFDEDYHLRTKDLLFSWSGSPETSIDAFWYNLPDGWLNQHIFKVKPRSAITNEFLFYLLKANKPRLIDIARDKQTTGLGHVTVGDLKRFDVALPSLAEQKSISSILSSLDDKIELNRQINATLEKIASALFKRWFVDFEFPDKDGKPYKSNGGKMIESEMGEIPEGWRVETFSESLSILSGGTPKTSIREYWDGDIPWYSVVDSPRESDVFVVGTEKHVSHLGINNSAAQILDIGTTIISARGTVGKVALVGVPMAMNQSCFGLRGNHEEFGYYTYFKTQMFVDILQQSAHGSVFDTINRDTFTTVDTIKPTDQQIRQFETTVNPLMQRILSNVFETQFLGVVRDSLLPRLMSGNIRVNEKLCL